MKKIEGLRKATVVKLENDPAAEFRILITPDYINPTRSIWAIVSTLDAGNNRGSFFMPEIGDDVIIGCIDGNPEQPVVLGMLHNKNKPAPITPKDVNHEKGFTTRSRMHILFNDDTRTIFIDTPAGNKIVIDEKVAKIEIQDQNNNKITLGASGITIKSSLNINIEAGNDVAIKAGSTLSLKASRIELKSDADTRIQASAGIQIISSATTEIKGSVVTIN